VPILITVPCKQCHAEVILELMAAHLADCDGPVEDEEPDRKQRKDSDNWAPSEHALYLPPWREALPGVGLSPSYGPQTQGAYQRVCDEYQNEARGAIGSPALWDREQAAVNRWREAGPLERKDSALYDARITVIAQYMPPRELECATLFWRQRMSVGSIARNMGVEQATVRTWVERTRGRMRA
jgi:hypothetical protein